jgi:hypothetical protein
MTKPTTDTTLSIQDLDRLNRELAIIQMDIAAFNYYVMKIRDVPLDVQFREILKKCD